MIVLLSTQPPWFGSIAMFAVSFFVTPIGVCCHIIIYAIVTKWRSFTLLNGVLSGLVASAIIFMIMVASGEPFLRFVSTYIFISGIVLGGVCTVSAYPDVRPAVAKWLRRFAGAKNSGGTE